MTEHAAAAAFVLGGTLVATDGTMRLQGGEVLATFPDAVKALRSKRRYPKLARVVRLSDRALLATILPASMDGRQAYRREGRGTDRSLTGGA